MQEENRKVTLLGSGKIRQWLKEVIEINNIIELSYKLSHEDGRRKEKYQLPFIKRRFKKIVECLEAED